MEEICLEDIKNNGLLDRFEPFIDFHIKPTVNPFTAIGLRHTYLLDESSSHFKVVSGVLFYLYSVLNSSCMQKV